VLKQDDELDKLDEDIRKLKNKYDQFFAGIQKMPPSHERRMVEVYIHELSKKKIRENARRFRLSTALSRFNQFREMWGRKMREREEGPLDFRRRQAAMSTQSEEIRRPEKPAARVTSSDAEPYVKLVAGSNGAEIRQIYDQIEKEHQKLGRASNVSFDQLRSMIEKQSESVRERYKVSAVAFRVDVVDGKVKLKAKPVQEK
jgi:cell division septum initiation protein DivIVA